MDSREPGPQWLFLSFTVGWGLLAWGDLWLSTLPAARAQEGGVLFAPHLLLLFIVSLGLAVSVPFLPLGVRWWWRLTAAVVPGSYAAWLLW